MLRDKRELKLFPLKKAIYEYRYVNVFAVLNSTNDVDCLKRCECKNELKSLVRFGTEVVSSKPYRNTITKV